MTFPLKLAIALTLLAIPVLEVALLFKAGSRFGFWPLFFVIVGTAVVGVNVIRATGMSIFSRVFAHLEAGGSPLLTLLDRFLAVTGGVLLVLPGLLGDAVGALLLVPQVRRLAIKGMSSLLSGGQVSAVRMEEARFSERSGPAHRRRGFDEDSSGSTITIIEGEYERIEDPPAKGRPTPRS